MLTWRVNSKRKFLSPITYAAHGLKARQANTTMLRQTSPRPLISFRRFWLTAALLILGLMLLAVGPLGLPPVKNRETPPEATRQQVLTSYGNLPLSFEVNQGQTDSEVKFLSRGSGYTLFLTSTEAVLVLDKLAVTTGKHRMASVRTSAEHENTSSTVPTVLRMKLLGANPAGLAGQEQLLGKSNYFIGNDPLKWRTNVPHYARVRYKEVYPGIDLVYYGNQRQLEYDFVIASGADPQIIRLGFDGAYQLEIDEQGDLILHTPGGQIRLCRPHIYQESNGSRECIAGRYVIINKRQVGFEVAAYDPSKPLIIDPVLSYSTYLGGNDWDYGHGIAVDAEGNAYVTGNTDSHNFPTVNPFQSAPVGVGAVFVTKLNPAGSALIYSTYLGGSDAQYCYGGIAVDTSGNACVTGYTDSYDFPTVNPFQSAYDGRCDAFVAKLNPTGSALIYSTYLGGSDIEWAWGIAVDISGNAYVTGWTRSSDFPTVNPFQSVSGGMDDVFITKFNSAGSVLYSTYLGGFNNDKGYGIATDTAGNAYVTGITGSQPIPGCSDIAFPTINPLPLEAGGGCPGMPDAFITKLNASGNALIYSTFLGGCQREDGYGIAVDTSGNAYVVGTTNSDDFPIVDPFQPNLSGSYDAFVAKLNPAGSALIYSTYLGGSDYEVGFDIAVDAVGNAYVTGVTNSDNFPTANAILHASPGPYGPFPPGYGGCRDAFVTKFNAACCTVNYSTYFGGSDEDLGNGIAVDIAGNAYVTGFTISTDFPTTAGAFQTTYGGSWNDAFVTKISELVPPCTFCLSPTNEYFAVSGGTGTVTITTQSGCSWQAASNAEWLTITSSSSGTDSGTLDYSVAPNATSNPRTGTMTIAGRTFTVNQEGTNPDFTLGVSPPNVTVQCGQAASYTVTVAPQSVPFNNSVSLYCSNLPALTSYSFSLSELTPGDKSVTSSLTVFTTAPSAILAPRFSQQDLASFSFLLVLPGLALLAIGRIGQQPKKQRLAFCLLLAVLLVFLAFHISCDRDSQQTPRPGTPNGTYIFTIKGTSDSLEHSITATLVVQ